MQEKLDLIIDEINKNPQWSKNVKIRYAYISLGKIAHKNVDFFYTLYKKLGARSLKTQELNEILESKLGEYVICKTSAEMLKYIFDHTGISSKIVTTVKKDEYKDEYGTSLIAHYFLSVEGDESKNYFLTLTPDLPNIQGGFKTEHFATNIPYLDNNGNQTYEGSEIKHSVMTDEEIQKLDEHIGYSNDKYEQLYTDDIFKIISIAYNLTNNHYLTILAKQTDFYYDLVKLINGSDSDETECINVELFTIKEEDWNKVKKFIYYTSMQKILFDNEIEITKEQLQELESLLSNNNYSEFQDLLKKIINSSNKKIKNSIFHPLAVLNKISEFIDDIDSIKNIPKDNLQELQKFKQRFEYDLNKICSYFIESRYLPPKNKKFTSEYIAHKIITSFSQVFEFGRKTEFNFMETGEQSAIISKVLEIILKELEPNKKNPNYDLNKSPVKNRIITSVIIDKETDEYKYLMYISNDSYIDDNHYDNGIVLVYDLKNNCIKDNEGLVDIFMKYYVVTDRLSIGIENIEEPKKRK